MASDPLMQVSSGLLYRPKPLRYVGEKAESRWWAWRSLQQPNMNVGDQAFQRPSMRCREASEKVLLLAGDVFKNS